MAAKIIDFAPQRLSAKILPLLRDKEHQKKITFNPFRIVRLTSHH
jgi:hypothetical protein